MPTCYRAAPGEIKAMADKIATKHHHDLRQADVSITYLLAYNQDNPAIMHNGWPAKALVRVNGLRDRVAGLSDVTMLIDATGWEEMGEPQRKSLLDHELQHIEVLRNKAGAFKYDDANRPKVRLRPHDFQLGGFNLIVQRHGADAHEAMSLVAVRDRWTQLEFSFEPEPAATP